MTPARCRRLDVLTFMAALSDLAGQPTGREAYLWQVYEMLCGARA